MKAGLESYKFLDCIRILQLRAGIQTVHIESSWFNMPFTVTLVPDIRLRYYSARLVCTLDT